MTPMQSVIICEGYHDRAFWSGWLKSKGCRACTKDPFGSNVRGGQYGFTSPAGRFIRVVPVHGDQAQLIRATETYLRNAATEPTHRVIITTDADDLTPAERHARVLQSLQALVTRLALTDCQPIDDDLRAGPTLLRPLVWPGQPITPGPGIPTAATLEQLICAALAHHEPRRTSCVSTFLATAGEGDGWTRPAEIGKSHAWAWMAHRRPIDECERFFEAPWEDPTLTAWLQAAMGPRAADVIDDLMT